MKLYDWYENGGYENVAAYLRDLDISAFNPKAPPPKTQAWWEIVDTSRAPEDAELADILDNLETPDVITLTEIKNSSKSSEFAGSAWRSQRRRSNNTASHGGMRLHPDPQSTR